MNKSTLSPRRSRHRRTNGEIRVVVYQCAANRLREAVTSINVMRIKCQSLRINVIFLRFLSPIFDTSGSYLSTVSKLATLSWCCAGCEALLCVMYSLLNQSVWFSSLKLRKMFKYRPQSSKRLSYVSLSHFKEINADYFNHVVTIL